MVVRPDLYDKSVLFIHIGTNGEVVLANRGLIREITSRMS